MKRKRIVCKLSNENQVEENPHELSLLSICKLEFAFHAQARETPSALKSCSP
jgi:hypothetical protein